MELSVAALINGGLVYGTEYMLWLNSWPPKNDVNGQQSGLD